ncbi:DNA modification methylase [Paenibacillus jiagnxiensis]|uniref:DNA modification methylase n=1 Tax=Paenibacillus jiagnxiensis TaxID=3228926 RepID=UPI0033B74CDE
MKSVVSYPERGRWGESRYRGNCSGYIIRDLLKFYKPKTFLEVFAGGGTGYDVAKELGYTDSIHLDLNPRWGGWNALKDEVPTNADFIFSHPPYYNMIEYSGYIWGAIHEDDLSRSKSYQDYIDKLDLVNAKLLNNLNPDGRLAVLVGDYRKQGNYHSIIKDMRYPGLLESHIIKIQHNVASSRKEYNGKFIQIVHEHLLIFKKG